MAKPPVKKTSNSRLDFEGMIEKNGDEFTAQTANGTAKWRGTGWNRDMSADYVRPQLDEQPTWPKGRHNRTGE